MRRILAIETATKVCSVAVADEKEVLGEVSLFIPQVHVERLVIMINNLLESLRLAYHDLDAVAVSTGPGSFTGLRIGLSAAKGIAFGQHKKLISVPTLEALAHHALIYSDCEKIIVPILHARANEFYYSSFSLEDSRLKMRADVKVAEAGQIADEFSADACFVGEGIVEFSKHENVNGKFAINRMKNIPASAKEIAMIAIEKFERGEFADLRTTVPTYIKDFVAVPKEMGKRNSSRKLLEKI
jgi:tRNA threonylcarbamoyladenosine biosynthesis protein TsaB